MLMRPESVVDMIAIPPAAPESVNGAFHHTDSENFEIEIQDGN